jgi:hypothetical protein
MEELLAYTLIGLNAIILVELLRVEFKVGQICGELKNKKKSWA